MANPTITNNDTLKLPVFNGKYKDATILFAGADTFAKGVVLGQITASGKWTIWTVGAADGSEVAKAILPVEIVATGAGDVLSRILIGGEVAKDSVSVDAGGAISEAVIESLRDYTILLVDGVRVDELDNQ